MFTLFKLFASEDQQASLAEKYRAGGMGYGEAKQALYDQAIEVFGPAFDRRAQLAASPDTVQDVLREGAKKARVKAVEVLARAREACGLGGR